MSFIYLECVFLFGCLGFWVFVGFFKKILLTPPAYVGSLPALFLKPTNRMLFDDTMAPGSEPVEEPTTGEPTEPAATEETPAM